MKNIYILILVLMTFNLMDAQIVNIPDANFKNTLVSNNCVDINGDGMGDIDADVNNDGEIQQTEAEAVLRLIIPYKGIDSLEGIQSFVNLENLYCEGNQLSSLDLSQNINLEILNCSYNNLTSLITSQNPNLVELHGTSNEISSLDLSQNGNLEILWILFNQLTTIDVTQNPFLRVISCSYNQLTNLDVTENLALEYIFCENNQLTSLDLFNPNLESLFLHNNQLVSLDVSESPNLRELRVIHNNLTSLDVSQNTNLELLDCRDNQISSLDVSNLSILMALFCSENVLTYLNINNGNNTDITVMIASDNPDLTCVQVDDVTFANNQICVFNPPLYNGWCIDPWANYSQFCELGVEDYAKDAITLYPNPTDGILNIELDSNLGIETLQVYNVKGELVLSKKNNFQNIDISMLKSGLYLFKINSKDNFIIKKIIKN